MKLFYQISTHWDREWWLPFQGFRFKLVKMTEGMLAALESGALDAFTFDGQTVVLEDYLEIRPGERERLHALIASGKLRVGPWYVMPDELLVSGESLVRNFLTGHAV
ncbi:MAG: glycoside hydrolase, partial [Clostridia bacterium]|nr:glycoside hydrolase [Clostridia bacterium]